MTRLITLDTLQKLCTTATHDNRVGTPSDSPRPRSVANATWSRHVANMLTVLNTTNTCWIVPTWSNLSSALSPRSSRSLLMDPRPDHQCHVDLLTLPPSSAPNQSAAHQGRRCSLSVPLARCRSPISVDGPLPRPCSRSYQTWPCFAWTAAPPAQHLPRAVASFPTWAHHAHPAPIRAPAAVAWPPTTRRC